MKGWHKENYRHSLAARGIRTNFAMEDVERDQLLEQSQLMKLVLENPLLGVALEKQNQELTGSPEAREEFVYRELGTASPEVLGEMQMEGWIDVMRNSNSFIIYLDEERTGIVQPLHFERKETSRGVIWVGELPIGGGDVSAGTLNSQDLMNMFWNLFPVITGMEEV